VSGFIDFYRKEELIKFKQHGVPVVAAPAPAPQAGEREKGGSLTDLFAKLAEDNQK